MDDMISRRAAIDFFTMRKKELSGIQGDLGGACSGAALYIASMPSVQPETTHRVIGRSNGGITMWYECEKCSEPVDINDNYCSGCGRRFENG